MKSESRAGHTHLQLVRPVGRGRPRAQHQLLRGGPLDVGALDAHHAATGALQHVEPHLLVFFYVVGLWVSDVVVGGQ